MTALLLVNTQTSHPAIAKQLTSDDSSVNALLLDNTQTSHPAIAKQLTNQMMDQLMHCYLLTHKPVTRP